jgi:hypothetical protein
MTTFRTDNKEFEKKYSKEIEGIARYNKVDLSTASAMFKTNLDQNRGIYSGGGVAENWDEMREDYKKLKEKATKETKDRVVRNSKGQEVKASTGEPVNREPAPEVQEPAPAEEKKK